MNHFNLFTMSCLILLGVVICFVPEGRANPIQPAWKFQPRNLDVFIKQSKMIKAVDQAEVVIRNVRFEKAIIPEAANKYSGNFIYIKNCKNVVLDGVIAQSGAGGNSAYQSILIEDCENVTITNCFFSGKVKRAHLRIEGCRNVEVSNVEVSGVSLEGSVVGSGIGVWINNGSPKSEFDPKRGMYSVAPLDLETFTLRDSYFHDANLKSDNFLNIDAVLIHSGSNGSVENCYFENWNGGDSALDISHRRKDNKYANKKIFVKDCKFVNCKYVKVNGHSRSSNKIVFSRNVFVNTPLQFYHNGYEVVFANDIFAYKNEKGRGFFVQLLGMSGGKVLFRSCLMYANALHSFVAQSGKYQSEDYKGLFSEESLFVIESNVRAVSSKNGENISSMNDIGNGFIFSRNIDEGVKSLVVDGLIGRKAIEELLR
ncbi:hypothetical protein [Pseudodesulfovibrio sp. zrk46]|uniref:hypothetical protein n=1 Tax=Pseudodesulfovibrio sp. zrk46 TaxID=2725288 RepID=UPI0014498130|nr:hypothetical protein [Pseudodesulfovibrio sp. zrk46]QJB57397.1 hypothetical protein HFN16_13715 [Pseudodesulfovibrio sp. zrk46]